MSEQPVSILGVGPLSPAGVGREELLAAIEEGLEPVGIGELDVRDYVPTPKTYLDPNSTMTLCSVAMALQDAGVTVDESNETSVGMSFGTRLGNMTTVEGYLKGFIEQGPKLASPLLFIHAYPNTSLSLAAIDFRIKGTSFNFNSGRFAGLQALLQAVDELRSGKMSVMLAGAADTYTEATRCAAAVEPFDAAGTVTLGTGRTASVAIVDGGLAGDLERAFAQVSIPMDRIDWVLTDLEGVEPGRAGLNAPVTNLHEVFGDGGAATAVNGVILAALVMAEDTLPAGLGLQHVPGAACVLSADASGAAVVILRKQ